MYTHYHCTNQYLELLTSIKNAPTKLPGFAGKNSECVFFSMMSKYTQEWDTLRIQASLTGLKTETKSEQGHEAY
jgi:hypothetical protein